MRKFLKYLKSRGFTLVEALVATIIAGYCMLPIMGTLQSGIEKTQGFDHKEKLRVLARSRLNKELSVGAFDHTAIDASTMYHYVYYNNATEPQLLSIDAPVASDVLMATQVPASVSSIVFSYKVSVAVKENLKLGTSTANIKADYVIGVSGLKAVTVMAELEPNDNVIATDSISLFSLLNIPNFSEDYIWVSNPKNVELIAIDPISRTRAESFLLPLDDNTKPRDDSANDTARPWNIAVHPNHKFIIIQCKHKIKALNIDRESPKYGQCKEIWPQYTINGADMGSSYASKLADVVKDDKTKAAEDRGIVFRPDGKFCYVAAHDEKKIFSFVASNTENWDNLALLNKTEFTTTKDKNSVLHAGADGWLYVGPKDANKVIRYPMYHTSIFSQNGQEITDPSNKQILAVDTLPDGKRFFILWQDNLITRHNSLSGEKVGESLITPTPSGICNDMFLSGDGRYLAIVDAGSGAGKGGFFLLNLSTHGIVGTNYSLTDAAVFKKADPNNLGKKEKTEFGMYVPQSNEFIFDEEKKPFLFNVDIPGMLSNTYSSGIPEDRVINFATADKSQVAFTARKPEYLLVGLDDKSVNFVDVNTGKANEGLKIPVEAVPVDVALTPRGEKFKVVFGTARTGVDTYDIPTRTRTHGPHGAAEMVEVAIPNTYFHTTTEQTHFTTMEKHSTDSWRNGYWADVPLPGTPPSDYRMPNDIDFSCDWVPQNMVPLNDGGFLYLFKKADGSTCLEWVGNRAWGSLANNYERFARWYSIYSAPPTTLNRPATMPSTSGTIDSGVGTITLLKSATFPTDYKITRVKFNTTAACSGRSITPVIVEMSVATFTIRDIGNPVTVSATSHDQAITWEKGGKISLNYLVGWWNGINATANAGVVKWSTNASGLFVSDYGGIAPIGSTIADSYSGSVRDYEIQFQGDPPPPEPRFPPLNARNLAVSPDDRYLAIETIGTPNQIHLYDFAADNFYHETQLNGLLTDYRDRASPFAVYSGNASSKLLSPTAGCRKLNQAFTGNETWAALRTTPLNYSWDNSATSTQIIPNNNMYTRIFGYLRPESDIQKVGLYHNDSTRLFLGSSLAPLIGDWRPTAPGFYGSPMATAFALKIGQSAFVQAEHDQDDGNTGLAVFKTSDAGAALFAAPTHQAAGRWSSPAAPWVNIPVNETMPFKFEPTWLRTYNLTGCDNDQVSAIAWSRDLGNPLLFHLDTIQDDFWAIRPGNTAPTRFDMGGTFNSADRQLVVSDDGQKLIFAKEDTNEVIFIDIANPASFSFNGATRVVSTLTGFGSIARVATMTASPKVLATLPFNRYKSTAHSGSYQQVATLAVNISGLQNAALASGGIYILGGSPTIHGPSPGAATTDGTPTNNIFKFDPTFTYMPGATISPLVATLTRPIKRHAVVAYDNEVYVFNGRYTNTDSTSWVQKYNPTTEEVFSSPESAGPVTRQNIFFTSACSEAGNTWTQSGHKVSCNGYDTWGAPLKGWKAFDGLFDNVGATSTGFDYDWAWNNSPPVPSWLLYEFPVQKIITKIRHLPEQGYSNRVEDFSFYGSNNGLFPHNGGTVNTDYWLLFSKTGCTDSTAWQEYSFANSTGYKYYLFRITNAYDSDWICIADLEYHGTDVAPPPKGLTPVSNDSNTEIIVSDNAACLTPYGIMVSGGETSGGATSTTLIYWPHGIATYSAPDINLIGISRNLPPMPAARSYHNLVWHKGRVFRVGGDDGTTTLNSIDVFSFDTNAWTNVLLTNVASFPVNGAQLKRENAPACSLGDEIFIFGGYDGAAMKDDAIAWNPETGNVRLLGTMPMAGKYAKSAVACGSSIYLIGGATNATSGGTAGIWKFTP